MNRLQPLRAAQQAQEMPSGARTGRGKTEFFEGDGLQAVRKRLKTGPALAAEGTAFASYSTFFRSL
jgi:hypothetical protein